MRTMARVVVPRTIESSTTTSRLPAMFSRSGLSLRRTPRSRSRWSGRMKVRPMYRFLTSTWPYGMPLWRGGRPRAGGPPPGAPLGRRQPRVGYPHDHVGLDRVLLGQQLAHADAGAVHLFAVEAAVGP